MVRTCGIKSSKLFVKMVFAKLRNNEPPELELKTTRPMAMGTWVGVRRFWTLRMGCYNYIYWLEAISLLKKKEKKWRRGICTICMHNPRPTPNKIWYPIHLPVEVSGASVARRLLAMTARAEPPSMNGVIMVANLCHCYSSVQEQHIMIKGKKNLRNAPERPTENVWDKILGKR